MLYWTLMSYLIFYLLQESVLMVQTVCVAEFRGPRMETAVEYKL